MTTLNKISEFFYWDEVTHSSTASRLHLDNTPPKELVPVIFNTAAKMDAVRALLKSPVKVNSWYRSPEVNAAVGSKSKRSQHLRGEAVDFICPAFGPPVQIVEYLANFADRIEFDQMILEHTWVHISFVSDADGIPSRTARKQILTLQLDGTYLAGITDRFGKEIT